MNDNITNRIIQYLQVNSNYAIILSGEYGIGKTHFLKTVVFPKVENLLVSSSGSGTDVVKPKQIKYKTIHVSLFGVKSIEELQKTLFLEIYPLLKSKVAKVSKGLLKGVGQFFSINIDELIADVNIGSKQTGFENLLICIDDIDRKNPELDLTEVYGYVNDLVENHGAKIVLIANEVKLREEQNKNSKDNYSILREKVIGVTIPFIPDLNKVFCQIIDENYKQKDKEYYDFLKIHEQEIVRVIKQADNNLRNLIFFLEHFKIVYKVALLYFKEYPEVSKYVNKLKKQILTFTLPVSIEYKIGKLIENNISTIKDLYSNNFRYNFDQFKFKKEEREKTYREVFIEKYFKDVPLDKNFFPSVFNYILGKDEFTIEKFGEDISFYLKITDKTIPEEQELLQELAYWECVQLSENNYKSKTNKLIQYIKEGKMSLDQYVTVFHYATRFNNILEYNLDDLKGLFFKSMYDNTKKFGEVPIQKLKYAVSNDAEYKEYLSAINEECLKVNKEIQNSNKKKYWLNKYEEFKDNYDNFIDESRITNSETSLKPYLSYFPTIETADFVINLTKIQIISFAEYIRDRYKSNSANYLSPDKKFLEILRSKATEKQRDPEKDKIDKLALKILIEDIRKALRILEIHSL